MEKKYTILMALMGLEIGGAETHVVELSKELHKQGHRIVVASNGGVYVKELTDLGIKHYSVPLNKRKIFKMIESYFMLRDIIKKAIPKGARIDGPHPAKRTFQAIRIEVNNELGILENTMITAVERLKSGGRIGVITFHSLEDRIIKQTFAKLAKGCTCPPQLPVCVCGKKPLLKKVGNITPSKEEVEENPRSRSARLRYAIKI